MAEVDRFQDAIKDKIKDIEGQLSDRYERFATKVKQHLESELR